MRIATTPNVVVSSESTAVQPSRKDFTSLSAIELLVELARELLAEACRFDSEDMRSPESGSGAFGPAE